MKSKYEIYQILLSEEVRDAIEICRGDRATVERLYPVYKVYNDATLGNHSAQNCKFYKHVADIDAHSLEHAFEIGNIGPEYNIKRIQPMHSISVGDIVHEIPTGKYFFCEQIGWQEIFFSTEVS
jgi:hypothetical protein